MTPERLPLGERIKKLAGGAVVAFSGASITSRQRRLEEEEVQFRNPEGDMQVPGALPFGLDSHMPDVVARLRKQKDMSQFVNAQSSRLQF